MVRYFLVVLIFRKEITMTLERQVKHSWILFGGPGSPKKELAGVLETRGYHHVHIGDDLRNRTECPITMRAIERGKLVPDEIVLDLIAEKIPIPTPDQIVFTGLPRTVRQVNRLFRILKDCSHQVSVVMLDMDIEVANRNILERSKHNERKDDKSQWVILERHERFVAPKIKITSLLRRYCDFFHRIDANHKLDFVVASLLNIVISEEKKLEALQKGTELVTI